MSDHDAPDCGKLPQKRPIDAARLEEMALAYVARFATSAAKLERYLLRKVKERGWAGEAPADTDRIVARFVELGYVDDAAFARTRAGGLLRRGYGPRRVNEALGQAGIAADLRRMAAPGEADARHAVLTMARKRGFGPFGPALPERAAREKQLAAMLRAGHSLDHARRMVSIQSIDEAEEWAIGHDETY